MRKSVFSALASSSSEGEEEEAEANVPQEPRTKQVRLSPPEQAPKSKRLSLLTFNVLADHLCRPSWFQYRSKDELAWETRRDTLKQAILRANASIVCLQEIQTFVGPVHLSGNQNHNVWFDEWLRQEGGYSGVYGSRMNHHGKEMSGVQIGNMVYFKTAEFEPLRIERNVALLKTIHQHSDKDVRKIYCHTGVRGTVATFVALECKQSKRRTLIVTTHLPAPRNDNDYFSQLEQILHVIALMMEISKFCEKTRVDFVVCAGDLNAMPNGSVCEFLRTGQLSAAKLKRILRLAQQAKFPAGMVDKESGTVRVPGIALRSSNTDEQELASFFENALTWNATKGMRFTNQTNLFTGWLDHVYIMSSPGVVDFKSVQCVDSSEQCNEVLLPHPSLGYGSDHLPVLCEFTVTPFTDSREEERVWTKHPLDLQFPAADEDEGESAIQYELGDDEVFTREFANGVDCIFFKLCGDFRRNTPVHLFIAMKQLQSDKVYMFDLKDSAIIPLLQSVMENPSITKVTFDCRQDSDILFHNYKYTLCNVLDLQAYVQAVEFALDPAFEIAEPTQTWFPFLPTLERAKTKHLAQQDLESLKRTKPCDKWTLENPFCLEYVSSQLVSYEQLVRTIKTNLSKELVERLELFCQWNLSRFRDRPVQVDFVRDKRLVLQEISMRGTIPGEDKFVARYSSQWLALGLMAIEQV